MRTSLISSLALALTLLPACGDDGGGGGESGETEASSTDTDASTTDATDTNTSTTNSSTTNSSTSDSTDTGTDPSATDTSNDDSSSDGSGGCDTGFSCIPETPMGWQGPVILAENPGGGSPGCSGDYPNEVVSDLGVGLQADEAECGCNCGEPQNIVCKGNLNRTLAGDAACSASQQAAPITTEICSYISLGGDEYAYMSDAYLDSGQCSGSKTENFPEPTWEAGASICQAEGSDFEMCDDGVCVPYDSRLCVYRTGNMESCPMGYPYPFYAFTDIYDDRACSSCSCAVEEDCTGTISMYQSGGGLCNSPGPDTMSGDGSCYDAPSGGIQSVYWEVGAMSCGVSTPSTPSGGVEGQNGTTVCCTSEG